MAIPIVLYRLCTTFMCVFYLRESPGSFHIYVYGYSLQDNINAMNAIKVTKITTGISSIL